MTSEVVVSTTKGALSGVAAGGTVVFRRVPYGAPAGGERRFRRADPCRPWDAVRKAQSNGARARSFP